MSLLHRSPKAAVGRILRVLFPNLMFERDLRRHYFRTTGRVPNFRRPRLFTEKIQHRKIFDRDPRYTQCADKVLVKDFVRIKIGSEMLIPTLYSGPALPPRAQRIWPIPFVIKANHGCGFNIFVRETPDWPAVEQKLHAFLTTDFSRVNAEPHYALIDRQVLVEPFVSDNGELPIDYKIFVFAGAVKVIQVDTDRKKDHKRAYFDTEWRRLDIRCEYPMETREIAKPVSLALMVSAASSLGNEFDFVRVDFYKIGGRPYFGEMTFTPEAGFQSFEPHGVDEMLGQLWPARKVR